LPKADRLVGWHMPGSALATSRRHLAGQLSVAM
jgi:hypothetical protein